MSTKINTMCYNHKFMYYKYTEILNDDNKLVTTTSTQIAE